MQNRVKEMVTELFADHKKRRRLSRVVAVLSLLVVAGVFWRLMQPVVTMTPDPICGIPAHTHDASCYERVLTCGQAESDEHTHSDDCYKEVLACGMSEHKHTDDCYPTELNEPTIAPEAENAETEAPVETEQPAETEAPVETEQPAETEAPVETEQPAETEAPEATDEPAVAFAAHISADARSCFTNDTVNFTVSISGEPTAYHMVAEQDGAVIAESDSFEESFSVTARELDKVSAINVKITAENANGETAEASISVPCALREEETASGWAKSAYIQKTGVWADDLLSVAKTQLGYRESERNFIIDSKGETFGYTRYGDWYGAKYRDWCAMFVSFCLNYADVPADYFPREASSQDWIGELKYLNLYEKANEYTPAPGDLIFFDWERDDAADHVGLVEKVDNDTVYTIEGNNGKVVAEHRYALNAKEILGYGKVSAAQEKYASAHTPNVDLENIAGAKAVVSASEANLRSEASAASERVAKLEQGTSLTIESAEQSTDGYWYKVESETEQGYIRADLVAVSETDEEPQIDAEPEITAEPQTAATQDGNVTVTFVINNSVYTSDNGWTHLTSTTDASGHPNTALTFTQPSGISDYYITGTGVLESYTIPVGTSMTMNGYDFPKISMMNNVNSSKSYDARRWISKNSSTVFNPDTVFDQDTTFELRLFETGETRYTPEYVCGTDRHSILYSVKGYPSVTLSSGEYIPTVTIPTAEDVYNQYKVSWCSHGVKSNEILEGWYMDSAYTVPLTASTDISEYANGSSNVKVYAKWKTLTDSDYAIVTFTGSETRKVVKGFKLGDLPSADSAWIDAATGEQVSSTTIVTGDMTLILESGLKDFTVSVLIDGETTAYTVRNGAKLSTAVDASGNSFGSLNPEKAGYVFTGWKDESGNAVTGDTIVTDDMTITAAFAKLMNVNFVAINPKNADDTTTQSYTVAEGGKLSTAVAENDTVLGDALPTAPEYAGYAFVCWQDESGKTVTSDTIVSGDMTITAVYAELVNVHFVSVNPVNASDTSNEIYTVEKGAQLSAAKDVSGNPIGENLPEAKAYDGYEFIGWFYKVDDTSNGAEASLTQTIAAETYFTANYKKIEACTLTLHDVKPDGTEYAQDGVSSIDILVPAGGKLRDVLAEYELYDGVDASTCIWYTQKGTAKEKLDLDTALTANTDIYTYTYQLKLSVGENSASLKDVLFPTAYAVTTDVTGGTLTLTAREGEKLKASDFVVNGVDYSLYTWKKSDNTTISASDLIANGLTGNIEAVGTQALTTTSVTVNFYASIDGSWKQILSTSMNAAVISSKYYLSAAQLESVYGEYGFVASDLKSGSKSLFPYCEYSNYLDNQSAIVNGNVVFSQIKDNSGSYYVYYCPKSSPSSGGYGYISSYTAANTHYTITVLDDNGDAISELSPQYGLTGSAKAVKLENGGWKYWATTGGSETNATEITVTNGEYTIPADSMTKAYTFKRTTPAAYSITLVDDFHQVYTAAQLNTLNTEHQNYPVETPAENIQITVNAPASSDYYWKVFEADGTTEVGSNEYAKTENGETITFTFAVVNKNYVIKLTTDGDVITVKYITNTLTAEQCGTSYPASTQTEWPGGRGPSTVQGQDTPYIEQVVVNDQTQYSVKAPDTPAYRSKAAYGSKGDMLFTYRFWGWELTDKDGNAVVLSANDMLDKAKLSQYAVNGTVTLTARYSAKQNASDARIATASFFVIVNSKLADVGGGSTETPIGNYSDALYTTAVYGDVNDIALSGSNGQLIYASTGALTAAEVDTKIRALTEGYTNDGKTVYLDNLPSDEYCLSRLRTWASRGTATDITIDDVKIPTENLTTENYTIRWFVFKYDGTDGWHIDGLLVPKQGKLTIKKTFDGNAAAVAAVKANFEITVTKSGETTAAHTLNLNEKTDNNAGGYTEYDAATDTYTWVVDIDQTQKYTVAENNYEYTNGGMTTSAEYAISNSSGSTSGYRKYTRAVEVTAYAYATDVEYVNYQTVAFRNTYIPSGTLVVRKVDSVTGQAIQGVSFVLKKDSKIVNPLYKAGDSYYLYKPEDGVAYEMITDGTVTTNASGYFNFVRKHESTETFTLEEQPLPGYKAIEPITIVADANGNLTVTSEGTAAVYDPTTRTITVKNTAERLLKITVKKEWAEGDTKKEVKVHLMYNGNLIRTGNAADDVTLNESNNWTHEWTDQPLYVNGKPVTYSIRETWIGDTAYSANADADGYQDYVVTVDPMVYDYGDGTTGSTAIKEGTENKYAQSGTITVHNATYKGQIVFQKTDEDGKPLGGAMFKLYADEDMSGTPRAEATSNGNGQVSFGEMPVGTYYFMKETNSPAGYKDNATKYRVTITSTGTKIEYLDGTDWKALNGAVINEKIKTAEITLLKVNEKGNALSGAAFQLRNAKGENIGVAQITDAAGKITFTGLTPGGYQLVETAAPAGYYKMTATIEFTVSEDGMVSLNGESNDNWSLNGITFTVTNHAGSELPETGGSGTIPYTIGGLLLMAASLLCGLNPRRRRERRCER